MSKDITTLSVHPDTAEEVREIRDERGLDHLDAAVRVLLDDAGR